MARVISVDLMELWRESESVMVVEVRGHREFGVRIWLAMKLIALACWVAQVGFEWKGGDDG